MPTDAISPAVISASLQDEQAVAAVRGGDAARYRELVERHQRRIYAVAWSRLGDATLAEEATQEAFIQAYRHLPLLGDGAKFSAWIGAIARNLAISLGLRHRRELNRSNRWALEQPTTEAPASSNEEACTPEMLRQTLAELPAAHRECLVLFYLEDKSGAEAAALLGISEVALRMRLVRARAALREKLEKRLDQSLEQLRPPPTLLTSVMAVVLASPAKVGGGAGVGATIMAALGKMLPFKLVAVFTPAVIIVPNLGLTWWTVRADRRNFKDAEGFRVRLHREFLPRLLWFSTAAMVLIFGVTVIVQHAFGIKEAILALGWFMLLMVGFYARGLAINRSRAAICMFISMLVMALAALAVGLGWIPLMMLPFVMGPCSLAQILALKGQPRPLRMDYNLFLRATQGMLKNPAETESSVSATPEMDRSRLLDFACFLRSHFLILNFRWQEDGLGLCLPGVKLMGQMTEAFFLRWKKCSWIVLGWNGAVQAHCGMRDVASLQAMDGLAAPNLPELEAQVAAALPLAWNRFRAGDVAAAEQILGQVPDAEVFRAPPTRSKARSLIVFAVSTLTALAFCGVILWLTNHRQPSAEVQRLQQQVEKLREQEAQDSAESQKISAQNMKWIQQEQDLRQQAQQSAPADAQALRDQAYQLGEQERAAANQATQLNIEAGQILQQVKALNEQIYQLSKPF